jgi:catechol 2,3-dioxygenase-like lactoylglutathione lyase family enzyme
MANLENLKKQAKLYLRWHREGRFTVAAMIRGVLPGYAALSDQEVLRAPFRLADAQELVARRHGFSSWSTLREGHQDRTSAAEPAVHPSQPILLGIEPCLFVTDFPRALAFFTEKLGFKVGLTYGEPAFFGNVVRDAAILSLRWVADPVLDRSKEENLLSASILVSNAKQLFREFQERGAPFHQPLRREPWHGQGQGNFIVADPDGNLIMFGGRTD